MIISLRGTNGAGKSTIVRGIIDEFPSAEIKYKLGRRRPVGIVCPTPAGGLFVPGHYEINNGGIDTMEIKDAYELIEKHAAIGMDILYEGHNMSDGLPRLCRLSQKYDCRVVLLSTSVEDCIASVRARGHRIAKDRIGKLHAKMLRDYNKFRDTGVGVEHVDRVRAPALIREWLGIITDGEE